MHYKPSFAVERVLDMNGYTITKNIVTVRDATKEESTHEIYFLGQELPKTYLARSLGDYGYELMTVQKVDQVRGSIAWKDIFEAIKAEEVSDDRLEQSKTCKGI